MSAPVRYTNGVSSVAATDRLAQLPYLDPTTWAVWQENFIITPNTSLGWTLTQTNGTLAQANTGPCGGITLTLAGGDNDLAQLYPTLGQFTLESTKKAYFEVKMKVNKGSGGTIGQQELFFGLTTVATSTNFFAADGLSMAADNVVGFSSYDGSTNLNAIIRVSDVESVETGATTYAEDTEITLTWYFDGTGVWFYADNTAVAHLYTFPTGVMTPCLYIKAGEAFASVLTAYYMLVARER